MTDRPVRLSPDFNLVSARPLVQFRHVALLVLGSLIAGSLVGFLTDLTAEAFTDSKFVLGALFSLSLYGTFLVGHHRLVQEHDWDSLRTRFAPVGRNPLILSALGAVAVFAFISMLVWSLPWLGIKLADVPQPFELDNLTQLPLAFFLIVLLAPFAEELLFRGLLLDWLRTRMNVWTAALILSLIFSLLHLNPFSLGAVGWLAFFDRFLIGMLASALTIKYRSLRPAFVLHATLNAIAGFGSIVSSS
jgi:membrane protease YdiL (CAAX protease family)